MNFIRLSLLSLVLVSAVFLPGCGYHLGSIAHPQIKTVAIADVKNETFEVLASALLRNTLAERFQFDNSLKLTTLDKADCIVYARIVNIYNHNVTWRYNSRSDEFKANDFRISVTVEYVVRIPGRAQPLVPKNTVTSSTLYLFTHDPAIGRFSALKQAMLRVSDLIVNATTEAW